MRPVAKSLVLVHRTGLAGLIGSAAAVAVWLAVLPADAGRPAGVDRPKASGSTKSVRYGRDVRPILSDRCFGCHGPDANARQADLRLDVPESALAERDGALALVPGQPEQSELWHRVSSTDPAIRMPPADSGKRPLSDEEREIVRQWIAQGAEYEPHWAFEPPARPEVPGVQDAKWARNPIDRFILSRLEDRGIAPSPEASRETLIRRVFLDLTGLPPTPKEWRTWLADDQPHAHERLIDTLMTEEPYRSRYAERVAVPWLDAARYADTCGIHTDAGRQIWLWRDWVLEALRDNKPFDEFLIEQLAGDLLPEPTLQQKIATGFNRNHVITDEGGAIPEEYLVEYAVDRTNTTGSVFLGLTLGCARCHDHKYDPISQEEYYGLFAFFNSNDEPGLYSQLPDPQRAHEPFLVAPTEEQKQELARLREEQAGLKQALDTRSPEEKVKREAFMAELPGQVGLAWKTPEVTDAESKGGATLTTQPDGSVLASGKNPDQDVHRFTLRTDGTGLRLLLLEALTDKSLPDGRVGRAANGNAVLESVTAEAVSVAEPERKQPVRFVWAWADVEQGGGDYRITNILDAGDRRGWAVNGHGQPGGRVALLLAEKPFGYEGGTELRVRLGYHTPYGQHVLGRVRFHVASLNEKGLARLPIATSGWYVTGPFKIREEKAGYEKAFGPEEDEQLDLKRTFEANQRWRFDAGLNDGSPNQLRKGRNVQYVGRQILSPSAREVDVSLGSDDGFALFVNGKQVVAREVIRGVAPDQDQATLPLEAGANWVVMKIVNVGGGGGFYYLGKPRPDALAGDLVAALLPEAARSEDVDERLHRAWRISHWPGLREKMARLEQIDKRIAEIDKEAPRTMIMKELPQPRETFVLARGEYDKPDKNRPVDRSVPDVLGELPADAPKNRLGLAQWLTSADNPLVARVTVNRFWEMLFGTGIVSTSDDFGFQGAWPSHPELLDWLAVEFRESGWDVQHMIRLMMCSSTYRQQSRIRPELRERDPDNAMLASYPRRRLTAEFIRDQALYVAGLLVEQLGGPSVKPYQPPGLWREVAMVQSNTRIFERGDGEDLWRRSLYTYWKRACPPPSLMTFDAPTRESCTISRSRTNTPLQALVLWNDEQFVEAARVLAQRTCGEPGDDQERLVTMFVRCTGREPDEHERRRLSEALSAFRERYQSSPEDAEKLVGVGEAPKAEDVEAEELAAWTMIASAMLNLSETITQR